MSEPLSHSGAAEGGAADAGNASARRYADPYAAALEWQQKAVGPAAPPHRASAVTKKRPVAASVRRGREAASAVTPDAEAAADPPLAAPAPVQAGEVVCVEVPAASAPQSGGFAAAGGRLELRMRGLTALPCLHAATAAEEAQGGDAAIACSASAHGSGDALAARLHAVSLRQNAIGTLLTQPARAASLPQTPTPQPRSSPLQCYAHVSSLDLTHNALTSIAGIDALRCLRALRLACNRLTSLAPLWASPYVADLDVLDVSANALTELLSAEDVRALEGHHVRVVTHPTQAQSTAGRTRSVKSGQYKTMRLRVLYASSNQLREVPSALYSMTHLADLRLNKNAIATVPDGFPSRVCLPHLERLDLSMNDLPTAAVDGAARLGAPATPTAVTADAATPCAPARRRTRSGRSRSASSVTRSARAASALRKAAPRSPSPPPRKSTAAWKASAASQSEGARSEGEPQPQQAREPQSTPSVPAADGSPGKRKKPPPTPLAATAGAVPPGSEADAVSAVRCLAENVYCVDLARWAAVVRRRLESLLAAAPAPDTSAPSRPGAPAAAVSLGDVLAGLSEYHGGGAAAAGPRPRHRLSSAARAVASLQQCLPACTLSFTEDTQSRSPPLLILTGIAPGAVAAQDELLLLEVMALHLVTNCLSTARPIGGGSPQTRSTTPSPTPQLAEQRSNGSAANGSTPPPQPQDRPAAEPQAARPSSGARFTRSGSGASRLLNFAVGLHVVHVLDATAVPAAGSTTASVALMWAYVAWRQRWEAAVGRRRFRHRNSFVCETRAGGATSRRSRSRSALTSPVDPPQASAAMPDAAAAGALTARPNAAAALYPFPLTTAVPRAAEWRRLREYRPAPYAAVPPPWEALYDGLLAASTPATAVPPFLSGVGSRAHDVRGQPIHLASLLLCAAELPATTTATAAAAAAGRPNGGRNGSGTARRGPGASTPKAADVVEAAQRWRRRTCELWSRVEGETSTVAAEQETRCPLPVYDRAAVWRSQRAATSCVCGVAALPSSSEEADDTASVSTRASQQESGPEATTTRDAATPDPVGASDSPGGAASVDKHTSVEPCEVSGDGAGEGEGFSSGDLTGDAGVRTTGRLSAREGSPC